MATLTRPTTKPQVVSNPFLDSQVPSPFPREQLVQSDEEELAPDVAESSTAATTVALKDVMPSIQHVQRSCLMTLNNLLAEPRNWSPILPDRRHSMPSSPAQGSSTNDSEASPALHTLLTNLRNQEANGEMAEARGSDSDSQLLSELHRRVEWISDTLPDKDASLARALVSLLTDLNRLSNIETSIAYMPTHVLTEDDAPPPIDLLDTLTRQLSDLQIQRLSTQTGGPSPGPLMAVETTLLWSRIDTELDNVVAMCRERTETLPKFSQEHLPPQYDYADYDDFENPPDYELGGRASLDDSKAKARHPQQTTDEKMRLDLEAVTMAIDRLYSAAPQLHNQRVELKSSKLAAMERARREGIDSGSSLRSSQKGKERDVRELENLLELIGRASERAMKDQSVVLDSTMHARLLERARKREMVKKDAFVEQLVLHSGAGRLHGQDAVLQPRVKDPETMLTLPEFMREPLPPSERNTDLEALLTLPEFVRESVPPHLLHPDPEVEVDLPDMQMGKGKDKKRHRSLSAPPLAWLRSISSSSNLSASSTSSSKSRPKVAQSHGFDIIYVAENHENLHHTLVFFTVTGLKAGTVLHAEVLSHFPEGSAYGGVGGGLLVIKSGPQSSLPLLLPAHTAPGPKEVRAQSSHYEIKLMTQTSRSSSPDADNNVPLLDASQLATINPISFLCASCSLPVIQSNRVETWRDLPSEHWEELVEAWMCHGDQKLHDHVQQHSKAGFWPAEGLALVGGSYILFDETAMNTNNLHVAPDSRHDDNWRLTRCLCGAIVGRCRERAVNDGNTIVHRILKYAVRPVSLTADPLRIPLSAFIVEDMMEFVQAHASYRFVVQDEEEEKPRILIWLFKPRIHLSYTTSRSHAIPKSSNVVAAKVLYKLLKPVGDNPIDIKSILNKYPGFPQAEYLSYPMSICRRLAGMLKESNAAYPESLRMMTGLEVGWLQRASY
ncbi:hypothetical protein HYPSUDRAFT_48240 [Hypholoma sublateritium FD-334 SS-4]|uniref:HECT domain-containing protein n=1 Tax=Hypholoma sublateritium (strain FD-334 SS-4) TaxID=945553 RepID=A0A0D2LXJ1_HYPSF|nr:hypothetical protein HYPSUDRAFT_48240 [Hypholoma sublateritium FD-334 SS-4]